MPGLVMEDLKKHIKVAYPSKIAIYCLAVSSKMAASLQGPVNHISRQKINCCAAFAHRRPCLATAIKGVNSICTGKNGALQFASKRNHSDSCS